LGLGDKLLDDYAQFFDALRRKFRPSFGGGICNLEARQL
jgi:hypothetical protein